jgi:hypothetical protein
LTLAASHQRIVGDLQRDSAWTALQQQIDQDRG